MGPLSDKRPLHHLTLGQARKYDLIDPNKVHQDSKRIPAVPTEESGLEQTARILNRCFPQKEVFEEDDKLLMIAEPLGRVPFRLPRSTKPWG